MKLKNLYLDEWLVKKAPINRFPSYGRNYKSMYADMANVLETKYLAEVNTGALITDKSLLTDHGPNHIKTVIRRATALVDVDTCQLTPYEVYILLCAIHFHDIGNMYGRAGHEEKAREVIIELGEQAGTDDVERKVIADIAQAHGGKQKDKLEFLPESEPILNMPVRQQLLAAILKFADELSDEYTRRSSLPWASVPVQNQIYHKYAEVLKSVDIDHSSRTVKLLFTLKKDDVIQKFGDSETQTAYLFDEIKKRTFKTHLERMYCMRFMFPNIRLDSVAVSIEFIEKLKTIRETVLYRLVEKGYPDNTVGFEKICPEMSINGEEIKKELDGSKFLS